MYATRIALAIVVAMALVSLRGLPSSAAEGAARYDATWESLDTRPAPPWFREAKFGIFIHWGVYSVPAWGAKGTYAEWYWNAMQDRKGPTWKFHERVYGKDFGYEQFAPMFRAELFDPRQWADVFARSGARYVVLTSKHHEGFCLWPSSEASRTWGRPWNSVEVGPKRDLLGDLTTAVRARGLKMGFYYSLYEWYNPVYRRDFKRFRDEHFFPQFKDVVTRYKPSIIFADGEWDHPSAQWRSPELLAWLYNESGCGDDLIVNDRWGKECRGKHGGYYTTEYGSGFQGITRPWEENRGIGASFGFNRNENYDEYRTTSQLIRLLVEMTSQGGNLLLDIGPAGDGTIPVIMQDRLIGMGAWLKTNGEAIYGTTMSPCRKHPFDGRCTVKGNTLYVIVFTWPQAGVSIPGIKGTIVSAEPLDRTIRGVRHEVTKESGRQVLALARPQNPDPAATVIAVRFDGTPAVDQAAINDHPDRHADEGKLASVKPDATAHGARTR
jgi:alpha-L-fucosidase